ncbi:hypothetical protein Glove_251g57 [Diversispora epigaea]|uniref:Uncharacterized protein n=1 Tax=Diversispora epigaea TaxID=1348612 RepID=A0A397IC82_9GLOM|nr:hypothetical protein Glove_251g57 [Diversispora epigaea]
MIKNLQEGETYRPRILCTPHISHNIYTTLSKTGKTSKQAKQAIQPKQPIHKYTQGIKKDAFC